jgi:hypothetical protein
LEGERIACFRVKLKVAMGVAQKYLSPRRGDLPSKQPLCL